MLGEIKTDKKSGNETFINKNNKVEATLLDYWSWAHSDLIGNAERGILAEYIVSMALGVTHGTRTEWDSYDILTDDGIKIEIKSSGYIQTWFQNDFSKIVFGIRPTLGWNKQTNTYDTKKCRQADIYVFCIHKHKDQSTINPLDLTQWDFYVLNSKVLSTNVPMQKTISLKSLLKLKAEKCDYDNLKEIVYNQFNDIKEKFKKI